MGLDVDKLTNAAYVFYIIVGYFVKYFILFYIGYAMFWLLGELYKYTCSAFIKIYDFFMILIKPPTLKIFGLKFTNYFAIIDAFLSLLIGCLYLCIALAFLFAIAVVSVPFNFLFGVEL